MTARTRKVRFALLAVLGILVLAAVPAAFAGKGGGHSGGGTTSGSSSLSVKMVVDRNGDGAPNWNDQITFNVSTTATDRPWVLLNCYQSGTWVSTATAGFFAAYAWAPNFTLSSSAWTSGAGDCTATLYMNTSNGKTSNLKTLSFSVAA